jgi:hypothetical protein
VGYPNPNVIVDPYNGQNTEVYSEMARRNGVLICTPYSLIESHFILLNVNCEMKNAMHSKLCNEDQTKHVACMAFHNFAEVTSFLIIMY